MNSLSRKVVMVLTIIFAQSSLGTNAALKDFSNVTTKNLSRTGYYKFPDGLMIQWGWASSNQNSNWMQTVYLPLSFINNTYTILLTAMTNYQNYYVGRTVHLTYTGSFIVSANQQNSEPFYWMAIGQWK
ncbi:gp53-like domain-containing protein [Bacteroides thetaiotaomicron]|uniref:gp53-like domain-containing protein n=1 Tax=Bacteroides thetaiotaomicron TaxID=818 RepID=UPI001F2848B8|nr:hypothetical protein [Bacteroides thetaiotaomicron]MCE8838745.1 hypothetical protein [Bacteroides thetaiotaomicron]